VERWWLWRKGSPPVAAWRCAVGRRSEFVGIEEGFSFYRAANRGRGLSSWALCCVTSARRNWIFDTWVRSKQ
jgi:hypothetical protein